MDPTHPVEIADVFRTHLARCYTEPADPPGYAAAIADFIDREVSAAV